MPELHLKTAIQTLGHTRALKDGTVTPQGFTFDFEEVSPIIQAFRRMVRGSEFDVSEMAITTYLCARAAGKRITALPVFLVRAFHHGAVLHNAARGSFEPKQLEGRRVGVNRGYTVTTGVWARGVLQHQYGVDLSKITWVLSGDEHVAEFMAPANVVRIEPGQQLEQMLLSGEIAAATGLATDHPDLKPLIADPKAAGFAALERDGYYPINHTVVVRDELLAAHPQLAAQLFDAFAEAKRLYVERLRAGAIAEPTATDILYTRVMQITGADPLPYGVEQNRPMLEMVMRLAAEQGIIAAPYPIEQLFAAGTRKLAA
ncbi:MAG: ABC transporter substrate-binding protein [Pseudomonadota bacterium]